jgi:hypothetical protein
MLRETDAVATLAVKDLGVAARFYEGTLSRAQSSRLRRLRGDRT